MPSIKTPAELSQPTRTSIATNQTSLLSLGDTLPQVFKYLLDAVEVRHAGTFPRLSDARYHFEPAVLRTCKTLRDVGNEVFHRNHFILVSTTSTTLKGIIYNHGVRMWNEKVNNFSHYHMSVDIAPTHYDPLQQGNETDRFLICLDSLDSIIKALRLTSLVYQPGYVFSFCVKTKMDGHHLPVKVQRLLLEPFHQVQGPRQRVNIYGLVDEELRRKTERLMTPRILWSRARSWELLELIIYKKEMGDLAVLNVCRAVAKRTFSRRRRSAGNSLSEGTGLDDLTTVMALLPTEPLRTPPNIQKSIVVSVEFERYVLRALDYVGDMLEDKVEQKEGLSFGWDGEVNEPFSQVMASRWISVFRDRMCNWDEVENNGEPYAGRILPLAEYLDHHPNLTHVEDAAGAENNEAALDQPATDSEAADDVQSVDDAGSNDHVQRFNETALATTEAPEGHVVATSANNAGSNDRVQALNEANIFVTEPYEVHVIETADGLPLVIPIPRIRRPAKLPPVPTELYVSSEGSDDESEAEDEAHEPFS